MANRAHPECCGLHIKHSIHIRKKQSMGTLVWKVSHILYHLYTSGTHSVYLRQLTLAGEMMQDRAFRESHAAEINKLRKSDPTAPPAAILIGMIQELQSPTDFRNESLHSYKITVLGGNHTVHGLKSE